MNTNLTDKQQYWSEQLERADRNGQSLAEYAKTHNIPVQKLYQWRSTLKSKTTTRTLSEEVQFAELFSPSMGVSVLNLHYNHTSLQFDVLPSAEWLARLVRELHSS